VAPQPLPHADALIGRNLLATNIAGIASELVEQGILKITFSFAHVLGSPVFRQAYAFFIENFKNFRRTMKKQARIALILRPEGRGK
jgi:hypothetical protein